MDPSSATEALSATAIVRRRHGAGHLFGPLLKLPVIVTRSQAMYAASALRMTHLPDFSDVYRQHHLRVLNLCRYLLRSQAGAEDAAHEVFMKARRSLDSYDPAFPLANWILKIASNHCLDLLRRQKTERRIFGPESEDLEPPASGPGPLAHLLAEERGERVRQAIARLPEKYRLPLVLAYYNDFSYDEIGSVLGIGRNSVATLLYRGKRRLRNELFAAEEGPS